MIGKEILNYTIVSFVGKGGMGSVYLAEHKYIKQQKVAIKVINADMVNDFTRTRLQQEAEALARLNHPNIVHFLDYHIDETGNIYLIEEYAEGVSLEKYINEINGLIVEDRICGFFEPILDAMSYAHKMHIVHRDLKPSNIIIMEDGTPKILDFGIATLMRDDAQEDGLIMGTPSYMSPEQVKGENLDARSDIYSLGVVLYQMLTGAVPYDTTTMSEFEINRHVVEEPLPRLKSYYKYISDAVQKVVDKATQKNKAKRYQNCAEFKKALHHAIYPPKISMTIKVAAAVAVLLVLAGGFFFWDYNRTKVTYYKDYALRWGVPVGIAKIDYNTVQHRDISYRLESKAGKVLSIALINSKGKLSYHKDSEHSNTRYALVKYYYSSNGNLDYKEIYSTDSIMLYQMDYSDNLRTVTFRRNDQFHTEMDLQAHTTNYTAQDGIFERSRISRYLLTYDDNGYVTEKLFAGFQNIKRCDADQIYGIRYKHDKQGRVIEEQYIGIDGNIKGNSIGLAIKEFTFNENDDWSSVVYLNAERKQSHDGNNCCKVILTYDQWGNRLQESYYTYDDEPALRTDFGCYGFAYQYNEYGQRVKQTSIGPDGNPAYNIYGYVSEIMTYDENGFEQTNTVTDENDVPVMNPNLTFAYTSMHYENDTHGHQKAIRFYDENEQLYETHGVAIVRIKYNNEYKPISYTYYNANDEPVLFMGYYHASELEYDSLGQQIAQRYLNINNELTNGEDGYAECRWVFDVHGACTQVAYYSSDGKPTMCNSHYAFYEAQYDEQGNFTWARYFSSKHQLCMTTYGYAALEYQYDPVNNNEIACIQYNDKGDVTAKHYYEYDERGNKTKSYIVTSANLLKPGTVVFNYEYNSLNYKIREWYTDLSGNRCNRSASYRYAETRYEYDESGNIVAIIYLGEDGKPALSEDMVHRRERTYNSMNKIVRELNLGVDMKPVSGKNVNPEGTVKYDNFGRQTEIACFDGYGKPRLTASGYHRMTFEYDKRGLLIRTSYFNVNGDLTENTDAGYAKKENDYNSKQQDTENRYYNKNNVCIRIEQTEYNERGNYTDWKVLNGKRQYDDSRYGFSRLHCDYDETGIMPTRRIYYRQGTQILAWQEYDSKTNKWGDLNFGPLKQTRTTPAQTESPSNTNTQWKGVVKKFNNTCPVVVKRESQYTLKVISASIVTDKRVKVIFRTNCSKYEMMEADIKTCIATCKSTIASYKKQWNLPSSVAITYELQDSKNRILN